MSRWLIMTLLLSATLAMAQTEQAAVTDSAEATPDPCVALEEGEAIAEDDSLLPECEDPELTTESPELASESPELETDIPEEGIPDAPIDENELPTEATVDEEFTPGDEISEDYPIPLPADI